jgi:cbb3-type cytochrome oxidase subunit 3
VNTTLAPLALWARDRRVIVGALLVALLALDMALILYNWVGERPIPRFWRLGPEWSLSSIIGYAKLAVAGLAMVAAFRWTRVPAYAAWAAAFLIILVEDAFEIHDRGGPFITRTLGIGSAVSRSVADAAIMLAIALVVVAIIWWGYRATRDEEARSYSRRTFVLLGVLAFFVVVVDMGYVFTTGRLERIRWLVEEGGEIVALTLLVTHAVWQTLGVRAARSGPEPDDSG